MNSGEESALPMVSSSSSRSCRFKDLLSLEDSWMKISVVSENYESSKAFLLITCERGVIDKSVRLLIRESVQCTSLRTDPHGT